MELLRVENLTKTFKKQSKQINAVDHVSFSVEKGEFVVITGQSGSGKSTLMHMLAGLEIPTSGKVILDKTNIYSFNEDQLTIFRRRHIGMIYQFYNLVPTLNVKENIVFPILLDNKEVDSFYFNQIVSLLHLEDVLEEYPNSLSGGQQQRVAIARSLIHHPTLILADEPTGNLDSSNANEIMDLLKLASIRDNTTVIMITHDMEIAMQADRIYNMHNGVLTPFEDES